MAITTLDTNTALIVIDLQKGILAYPKAHPSADILERASALATAFRQHHLPVVLVTVVGTPSGRNEQAHRLTDLPPGWADLAPELNQQPDDHLVVKRTSGAFTNTDLEQYLKAQGVTQVVIVGVATSNGVESTARHAYELGFNVTLAIDAMTDTSSEAHSNSIERIFPRLGESGSTEDILALLSSRTA